MEARVVHISPCEQPFTLACAAATCQSGRHMRPMNQRAWVVAVLLYGHSSIVLTLCTVCEATSAAPCSDL